MKEKIEILREMKKEGYAISEEQIQQNAEWFTKEQLLKWKEKFLQWKKEN